MLLNNSSKEIRHYEVAIIGAGFAGLGAGIRLKMTNSTDFIIFEKATEIGGTWRDNTYPGCACDIPSFLYSYSFEANPEWTKTFSSQGEILAYMKHCLHKYKIEAHIQYNTEITKSVFEEQLGIWRITDAKGDTYTTRIVISAAGPFDRPFIPNITGKASFKGVAFHSSRWQHDIDLKGKTVAVIGTGASAIQFIPEIAKDVKQLYVCQRTPPWIAPKAEQIYTEKSKAKFRKYPWYQRFWREFIYYFLEYRGKAHSGDKKMRAKRKQEAVAHLHNSVKDTELRKKLTPDYEIGCKRILISENYYPALQQPNVALIAEAVSAITPTSIVTASGKTKNIDVIIYGTGFYATEFPEDHEIIGRNQRNLFKEWNATGGEAYYGSAVSGFPNYLFMVGPNTGLGHNSIIHMMESQLNYILSYLELLRTTKKINAFYDLKAEIQRQFNETIQAQLANMVWSDGGCKSYYLQHSNGKNTSIWPGSTIKFRKLTKKVKASDYRLVEPELLAEAVEETAIEEI